MPYDPDWDLEGDGGTDATTRSASADYKHLSYGYPRSIHDKKEEEQQDDYEDVQDFGEGEDVKVGRPGLKRSLHAPTNRLPFPGAAAVGRPSQVEVVVLHSSPRRDVPIAPASRSTGGYGDDAHLVTSDIVPQPRHGSLEESTAKAPIAPPNKTQPPVPPNPFSTVTPQPKKRGRPFGWRLGSGPYSAMRPEVTPGSTTTRPKPKKSTSEQKPRARSGRKPAPTARQIYLKLNPHFVAFRCEWEDCPAELQNLETLRKHLLIVHGRPPPPARTIPAASPETSSTSAAPTQSLTCKWTSCTSPPLPSREAFASHVEKAHLTPFLWQVGDGPRNSTPSPRFTLGPTTTTASSEDPLPTYLSDSRGIQVTPSVRGQQFENGDDRKKRRARVNRVLWLRDRHAPEEPEYGPRELEIIAQVMGEKRARQRTLREYAERVCGGGGRGGRKGEEGWRGLLA